MRYLLHLAFVLMIVLVGVGLFRGWFSFSRSPQGGDPNKVNVSVSVDTAKVKADAQKAEQFTAKVANDIKQRASAAKGPATK